MNGDILIGVNLAWRGKENDEIRRDFVLIDYRKLRGGERHLAWQRKPSTDNGARDCRPWRGVFAGEELVDACHSRRENHRMPSAIEEMMHSGVHLRAS